jgi:hypothetical protein
MKNTERKKKNRQSLTTPRLKTFKISSFLNTEMNLSYTVSLPTLPIEKSLGEAVITCKNVTKGPTPKESKFKGRLSNYICLLL